MKQRTTHYILTLIAALLLTAEITYDLTAWSQLEILAQVSNCFFWSYLLYYFLVYERMRKDIIQAD